MQVFFQLVSTEGSHAAYHVLLDRFGVTLRQERIYGSDNQRSGREQVP